ncbi:MAG TPA: DUF6531 domain-containing protein [Solirubrobacterales bacterium]|nr:DUF6531 domain-containing protein [Solirubrobacterales bacterium]
MSRGGFARRVPLALVIAVLVAICAAVPVLAEEALPPLQRDEALETPQAEAERETSGLAYTDLSPAEEKQLLQDRFASQLETIDADPARILEDLVLERIDSPTEAIVSIDGEKALLEAEVPLRAPEEDGDLHKVELGLEQTGDGYAPANPLVDLSLPASADEPIEIGDEGLAITPVGVDDTAATPIAGEDLFLPAVKEDTSLLLSPIASGVELSALLASRNSPEQLAFHVDVPPGATLRATASGGAEVVDADGRVLAVIGSPHAVDAQGTEVPVALETEGSTFLLSVPHREMDVAYPLFVDPTIDEIWTNFADASKLSYWTWSWSGVGSEDYIGRTSCIVTCWTGNGLYVRSRSNFAYPKGSWGRWWFTPQGSTTFMRRVVLGPVNYDAHGCTANEPHPYVGVWNDYSGWKVLMNAYPSGWGNYVDTGEQNLGAGTRTAFVGIEAASGANIACGHDYKLGGASLFLDDPENPTAIATYGYPTGWVKAGTTFTISGPASDPGLGVYAATLSPGGSPPVEKKHGCDGHYSNRCPANYTFQFPIGAESFDEGEKPVRFSASDALGKTSNTYEWQLKVDRTPPEVDLAGQLAEATDETEGDAKDDKDRPLPLPVYNLTINTTDGRVGTVASPVQPAEKRSGVKKIEVFLDQGTTPLQSWETSSCAAGNCPLSKVFTLKLNELSADTDHYLRVLARDFAGNVPRERKIEFEYIPATGIRDEYVMQYFPLPDGSGNEEEEEHPSRPELAVNLVSGNLVYRQDDLDVQGAGADLELDLYYNSLLPESQNTEWGDGWTLAQTPELEIEQPAGGAPPEATIVEDNGGVESKIDLPQGTGEEEFDKWLQATVTKEAGGGYELTDESGEADTAVAFSSSGRAEELRTGTAATVDLDYEGGDLAGISVEDPATVNVDPDTIEEDERPSPDLGIRHSANFGALGSADGQLKSPADVATDFQGNVWAIDRGNNRVEKFSPSGQFLAKFGSSGSANGQFSEPSAIALDSAGNIWIADSGNNRIQKFNSAGQYLAKWGTFGCENGQLCVPDGIAIDSKGNVIVSDALRVQKFTAGGTFVKRIGTVNSPESVAADGKGNLFVADATNDRVVVYDEEGTQLRTIGSSGTGSGQFTNPAEVAVDSQGAVWVGDNLTDEVQLFNSAGDFLAEFGATGSGAAQLALNEWSGIAVEGSGRAWLGDTGNNRVSRWFASPYESALHSANLGTLGSADGQLKSPADVAVDSLGNYWILDRGNNRVEKFSPSGQFLAKFGGSGSGKGQLLEPSALALDSSDNIWIADTGNNRVQKFNSSGQFVSQFGAFGCENGQLCVPDGIAIDSKGNVIVSDALRVQKFTSAGTFVKRIGTVNSPESVAADGKGGLFVADATNDRIVVYDEEGTQLRTFGSSGTGAGQFTNPAEVAAEPNGTVWVGDNVTDEVQLFNSAGDLLAELGATGSGTQQLALNEWSGIAVNGSGRAWIGDAGNNRASEWMAGRYTPPSEPPVTEDDPQLDVEVSEGLVDSVEGDEAGTIDYAHSGDLLTAVDSPHGKATYAYDGAGRMTKVTLPNGTYGEVAYEATYGRVKSVTVAVKGTNPKTTYFNYSDEPRRTTVVPPDAPTTTYDIAADGSIFKWWNSKSPPVFDDIGGTLYDPTNRETSQPIAVGVHTLLIQAHDDEGLASIQTVANNDQLVDEKTCQYPSEPSKCVNLTNEWVTETGNWPPGVLYLEVIATDRLGEATSQRFWVNVPFTPPPDPEAEEPPRFSEILSFREEFGLDLDLKGDEIAINNRIFDLMGAWHNPATPDGEVAVATAAKWGVPLRPVDVAEMEYREWYLQENASRILSWAASNAPTTYAGYRVDNRQGGLIYVGFTTNQSALVEALKASGAAVAVDRIKPDPVPPTRSLESVTSIARTIATEAPPSSTIVDGGLSEGRIEVGATNPAAAQSWITARFGANAPVAVLERSSWTGASLPPPRYWTRQGPLFGAQAFGRYALVDGKPGIQRCSIGFGAAEPGAAKPSGLRVMRNFALTAGHCFDKEDQVGRWNGRGWPEPTWDESHPTIIGTTKRVSIEATVDGYSTDAEAVLLRDLYDPPRSVLRGRGLMPLRITGVAKAVEGMPICASGGTSERMRHGVVSGTHWLTILYEDSAGNTVSSPKMWEPLSQMTILRGDSGGPVWRCGTGQAVGLISAHNDHGNLTGIAPLIPPERPEQNEVEERYFPYTKAQAPGVLKASQMGNLHLTLAN